MPHWNLNITEGPGKGRHISVEAEVTIGRSADNTLRIDDSSISRHHAVVKREGDILVVYDLESVNGVVVNGRRVELQALANRQFFRLGNALLQVEELSDFKSTNTRKVVFETGTADSVVTAASVRAVSSPFLKEGLDKSADGLMSVQLKLEALYKANQIIAQERDIEKLLPQVMEQILSLVKADSGVLMLSKGDELETVYVGGGKGDDVVISTTIVERAFIQQEAMITSNAAGDTRFESTESIIGQNITSAMCVPLIYQEQALGVIYLDSRGLLSAFDDDDLEMVVAFASPASIAIKNASYVSQLEQSYRETLNVLANAVELRDHYTAGHIWRVTNFGVEIARELGWSEAKLKEIEMGGVMHDIGKISIDNAILAKKGKLTAQEYAKVKIHPERGAWMMKGATFLEPLIPYCLYHHEHYDGTGYPYGLSGEDIPIEGRVIAVADAFDAMTSHRSYNAAVSVDDAVQRVLADRGKHFDPDVVDAFVRCCEKKKIDHILQDYMKNEKSVVCPFCSTSIKVPEDDIKEFECLVCHHQILLCGEGSSIFATLTE